MSVAEDCSAHFPDGVYFVNLAAITDPSQVLLAIGDAAGIPIEGDAIDALSSEFQDQQVLLVIDNFEHVAAGGPSRSPTSWAGSPGYQGPRHQPGPAPDHERTRIHTEPLGLPPTGSTVPTRSGRPTRFACSSTAIAVIPGFSINEENASPVASIVRKVDGLPLAIELAAARLRMLSPGALSDRLARSLDALGSGAADVPSRQRTLDAAIDWSYQLLDREEQALFCRLCVFQGGFTGGIRTRGSRRRGRRRRPAHGVVDNSLVLPAQGGGPAQDAGTDQGVRPATSP